MDDICSVLGNFALASPNDDHSKLFGYLGSNTQDLTAAPSIKSSAALTAAYEAGGITKAPDDRKFTAENLHSMLLSAERIPYVMEAE